MAAVASAAFTATPRLRGFFRVHELRAVPSTSAHRWHVGAVGGGSRLGSGPQSAQSVP